MTEDTMRAWVEVDLGAFVHNLEVARKHTSSKIMAVIKGNAHGHGAVKAAEVLEKAGADAFAVATLTEALELREACIKAPVLVLGWTPAEFAYRLSDNHIAQSVLDFDYACELSEVAAKAGKVIDVHIKLDTGMSRTGLFAQESPQAAAETIKAISELPGIDIKGIFTHFAAADTPSKDEFTNWQFSNYQAVMKELDSLGFDKQVIHHAANSAGILYHPEVHMDMVRMGVMMYGYYPNDVFLEDGPLEQALSLKARVIQVKDLPKGAHISYGCTAVTERPTRLAVVGAGYADSYPRSLSNKGAYAVIKGHKYSQIGRVCMDLCMFDVTDSDVKRGDEVILYGKGGMPLEEVAALSGSINCEPGCLLTNRVKKVYK